MLRLGTLSSILSPGYLLYLPTSLESTLLQTIVSVSLVWDLETKPWALFVFIPPGLALLLGQQTPHSLPGDVVLWGGCPIPGVTDPLGTPLEVVGGSRAHRPQCLGGPPASEDTLLLTGALPSQESSQRQSTSSVSWPDATPRTTFPLPRSFSSS